MQLFEKLQILRKLKNYTQSDIAEKLYVSRQTVQKWESGISSPDLYKLPDIAKLFGISTDDLLDESMDENTLLAKVLLKEHKQVGQSKEKTHVGLPAHSAVDWLIMIPALLGFFIIIGMLYVFGAMIVAMIYCLSGISGIWGVYSIVNTFLNISNGTGAILMSIGFAFTGIGLVFPLFWFGKWSLNWYKKLCIFLTNFVKNMNILKGIFKHEK